MKESRAKPKSQLKEKFNSVDINTALLEIMKSLCDKYCKDLDNYMFTIDGILDTSNITDIPSTLLEEWILNLTSILYFTITGLEEVGIKEDMCKSIRQELYAKAHDKTQGTVGERQNKALMAVQEEDLVLQIYSRAYKSIKQRVDAGYEMQSALKKVMSARITDNELSNSRYNGKGERE